METKISEIRKEYTKGKLRQCTINDNPFEQFEEWLNDAIAHNADAAHRHDSSNLFQAEGHPSTRTVLLKGVENNKFIFFTNYESRKGRQLAGNPYISLSFVWHKLERQVHIEGKAEKCPGKVSDTYFSSRPYKSKIGARISPQSQVISSRMEIMRAFVKEVFKLAGHEISRPDNWGGFAVTPTRFEFWQGRESRLHDRIQYILQKDGSWKQERLAP